MPSAEQAFSVRAAAGYRCWAEALLKLIHFELTRGGTLRRWNSNHSVC
jgi:hypothetical protein